MRKFLTVGIAVWVAVAFGCRSTAPDATVFHSWGWEDAKDAKAHLDAYKHILVVCIYEDRWEDGGPHRLTLHHYKGTVVGVHKCDWSISERIEFAEALDYSVSNVTSNALVGSLVFLFTSEHTHSEIGLDTGDLWDFDTKLERVLQFLYPVPTSQVPEAS
jgi:hypothetical protein